MTTMIMLPQSLRRSWSFGLLVSAAARLVLCLLVLHTQRPGRCGGTINTVDRHSVDRHSVAATGGGVSAFRPPQPQYQQSQTRAKVSSTTIGMIPPLPSSFEYDDEVVFFQRATSTRIVGRDQLERSIEQWESDFRTEVDGDDFGIDTNEDDSLRLRQVRLKTSVSTTVSPTTLLMRWNVTYIDPSVSWLVSLSETIPGWTPDFRPYTDKVSEVRKFSYSALGRLFADAVATGKLRVPLACIEGTATCEFREEKNGGDENCTKTKKIKSITEDLAYAQDLNRGAVSNRLCARDLQFFLEVARKPPEYWIDGGGKQGNTRNGDNDGLSLNGSNTNARQQYKYWEDLVTESLPWRSVPGMMDPMYIEGQSEDDLEANLPLVFGTLSVVLVLVFANWIAPNLIGQSLFGAPSYIVPPSELNDIIRY